MGKKTTKRKTRWRTLSIGEIASDTEDENQDDTRWKRSVHEGYNGHYYANGNRSGQSHQPYQQRHQHRFNGNSQQLSSHSSYNNKYNNSSSFSSHSTPTRHRSYHQTNDDKYKMSRSNSTASEPKITFNEDEYTRITTPRQDVLFKKGYLSKKKPTVQTNGTDTISTSAAATPTLTGGSCGESNPSTGYSSTTGGGTPEHTSLDGGDFYESELEHPQPFIFPNTYVDTNGLYYINTYDPFGPMMLMGPPPPGRFVHPVELYGPGPPPPLHCFPQIPTTNGNPHFDEFSYPITKRSSVDSQNEAMHNDEENPDLVLESNEEEITNGTKQEEGEENDNEQSEQIKDNSTICDELSNGENHQTEVQSNDASTDEIVEEKIVEIKVNGIKENGELATEIDTPIKLQNGSLEHEEVTNEIIEIKKVEEIEKLDESTKKACDEEVNKEERNENGTKNCVLAYKVDAEEFIPMSMRRERQVSPEIRAKFENFLKRQDEYKSFNGTSYDCEYVVGDFVPSNHLMGPPMALQHAAVMHPPTVAAQQFINSFEYNKSQQSQPMKPFVLQQNFNSRTSHAYGNRFNDNLVKKRRHFNRMRHINKDARQKDNVINVTEVTSELSNLEDKKIETRSDATEVNSTECRVEEKATEIDPPPPENADKTSTNVVSITENKTDNEKSASPTNKSASSKPKPKQIKSPAKKLPVNNYTNRTNDSSLQKTEMKNYAQVLKKSTSLPAPSNSTPSVTNETKETSQTSTKTSSTKSDLYDEISIEKYNELLDNTSEWIAVPTRKKSKIKTNSSPKEQKDQVQKVAPVTPKPKPIETPTISSPPRPSPSPEKDDIPSDKQPKKSPKSNAKPLEPNITKKKKNETPKTIKQNKPKVKNEIKTEESNDISSSSPDQAATLPNTQPDKRAKLSRGRNRMSHSEHGSSTRNTCDIAENIDKLREISSSDTTTNIDISQEIDRMIQKGLYANLGVPFESFSQTANDFMVIIDPKLSNVLSTPNQSSGIPSSVPRTTLSSTPSTTSICLDAVAATTSLKPPQHYNHVEPTDENKVMKTLSECQKLFASKTNKEQFKEINPKAIFDSQVQNKQEDNDNKTIITNCNETIDDCKNEVINDAQPENEINDEEIFENGFIEDLDESPVKPLENEIDEDVREHVEVREDYSLLNGDRKEDETDEVTEIEVIKQEDDTEVDVNSLSFDVEEIKDCIELNEDLVDKIDLVMVNEGVVNEENPLTTSQTSQASDLMTKSLTEVVIQWLAETKEKSPDLEILKSPEELNQTVDETEVEIETESSPPPKNVKGNPLFVASRNPKTILSDLDKSWSFSDEENDENDSSVEDAFKTNRRVAKSLSPPDLAEEVTETNDRLIQVSKSLTENVVCFAREIVNTVKSPVLDGVELTPSGNGINGTNGYHAESKVFSFDKSINSINNNNVLLLNNSIKGALVRDVAVIVRCDTNVDAETKDENSTRENKGANEGKIIFTPNNNNNYNKSLSCTEKNLLIVDNEDCKKDNERLSDGEDDLLNYWDNDVLNNEKQYEKTSGSSPIQITNNLSSNYNDTSMEKVFKAKMFETPEGKERRNSSVEDGVEVYESLYGKSLDYLEIKDSVLLNGGVNVGKHPRNIDPSGTPPRRGGGAVCCSIM